MAFLVAAASATAGVAFWKITQMKQMPAQATLMVLPEPRIIDDFDLVNHLGQPFTRTELEDRWTLIFFGFTHCPDVCPSALYELQQVLTQWEENSSPDSSAPQVVFVSIDPERDQPDTLQQYLSHFDPNFLGVTGTHEQLVPFTRNIGIAYRIEEHEEGAEHYSVDHSSGIMLINPEGNLHGVFPAPHRSELLADDLLIVVENS